MHLVGDRWRSGQWSVAEEHLASQTLLRALDRIRPDLGPDGRVGPLAVLAGVAGEYHMIGLVCLDHVLREIGWTVADLGADVPADDLARYVERNDARLVALSASDPARTATVAEAVSAVRAAAASRGTDRTIPIMLGGRLATHPGIGAAVGVDWTGATLVEAARFADGIVRGLSVAEG
jgi:methanogenic corrinoid protein MtbC1